MLFLKDSAEIEYHLTLVVRQAPELVMSDKERYDIRLLIRLFVIGKLEHFVLGHAITLEAMYLAGLSRKSSILGLNASPIMATRALRLFLSSKSFMARFVFSAHQKAL